MVLSWPWLCDVPEMGVGGHGGKMGLGGGCARLWARVGMGEIGGEGVGWTEVVFVAKGGREEGRTGRGGMLVKGCFV